MMDYGNDSEEDATASERCSDDELMLDQQQSHSSHGWKASNSQARDSDGEELTDDERRPRPAQRGPARVREGSDASDATVSDDDQHAGTTLPAGRAEPGSESDATISDSSCPEDEPGGQFGQGDGGVGEGGAGVHAHDASGTESDDGQAPAAPRSQEQQQEAWEAEALRMYALWGQNHAAWLHQSKAYWQSVRDKRRERALVGHLLSVSGREDWQESCEEGAVRATHVVGPVGGAGRAPKPKAPRARLERPKPERPPARPRAPKTKAGGLRLLLHEGMLTPGKEVLRIHYMQQTFVADLDEQGFILWEQLKFVTPSAWSIHVKRLANPSKKADDGWKSVKYTPTGETLEVFKDRLSLMQVQNADGDRLAKETAGAQSNGQNRVGAVSSRAQLSHTGAGISVAMPTALGSKGEQERTSPPGMQCSDQHQEQWDAQESEKSWIRCGRCEKLRLVPMKEVDKVDLRAPWFCEYQQRWLQGASCRDPQETAHTSNVEGM